MTVLKGNHHMVIWKFLEYTSGDFPVNQYFTSSDSTLWSTHTQVVPLGHRGHEWVKYRDYMAFGFTKGLPSMGKPMCGRTKLDSVLTTLRQY